jgi:hypothetical protein
MKSDTNLSRRRLLASMPAAAAMAPAAATALCRLPVEGDDPIFGLIAEHREAIRVLSAAYSVQRRLEAADKEDTPEWDAAEIDVDSAIDRHFDAEVAVLTMPPTTFVGIVALLDHAGLPCFPEEKYSEGNPTILESAGLSHQDDIHEAARTFLPMIAAALRKLLAA